MKEEAITTRGLFVSYAENMLTFPWNLSSKIKIIKHIRNFNTKKDIPQKQHIGEFISKQREIVEQYKWDLQVRKFKMCVCVGTLIYVNIWVFNKVPLNSSIYTILPHGSYSC